MVFRRGGLAYSTVLGSAACDPKKMRSFWERIVDNTIQTGYCGFTVRETDCVAVTAELFPEAVPVAVIVIV
jgi:hypothetical protein